jgi:hypothetical protein
MWDKENKKERRKNGNDTHARTHKSSINGGICCAAVSFLTRRRRRRCFYGFREKRDFLASARATRIMEPASSVSATLR